MVKEIQSLNCILYLRYSKKYCSFLTVFREGNVVHVHVLSFVANKGGDQYKEYLFRNLKSVMEKFSSRPKVEYVVTS